MIELVVLVFGMASTQENGMGDTSGFALITGVLGCVFLAFVTERSINQFRNENLEILIAILRKSGLILSQGLSCLLLPCVAALCPLDLSLLFFLQMETWHL